MQNQYGYNPNQGGAGYQMNGGYDQQQGRGSQQSWATGYQGSEYGGDKGKKESILVRHNAEIKTYGTLVCFLFVVFWFFSDGDFSFLLTLASIVSMSSFLMVALAIESTKSAKGISLKMMESYLVLITARLFAIIPFEGYLPYDRSGDWLYHVIEGASLAATVSALYLVHVRYNLTYEENNDKFGALPFVPAEFGALVIIVPCFVAAAFLHPALNKDWLSDTTWTYSMYLESFAILPQLFLFQKQAVDSPTVEMLIGHFVAAVGGARVIEMAFWMSSFHELADRYGNKHVGFIVLGMQIVHLIIMADFFYFYLMSLKRGLPMQLPTGSMV